MSSSAWEETPYWTQRYWDVMSSASSNKEKLAANERLLDHAVGTISTMYYDNSGGAYFSVRDFVQQWRTLRDSSRSLVQQQQQDEQNRVPTMTSSSKWNKMVSTKTSVPSSSDNTMMPKIRLDEREGAVQGLKWLVASLPDPFSKYLTREELRMEFQEGAADGFLGTGAMVEPPAARTMGGSNVKTAATTSWLAASQQQGSMAQQPAVTLSQPASVSLLSSFSSQAPPLLSLSQASRLPLVTAVTPHSPAERAGVVVGDRIVAVGSDKFVGLPPLAVQNKLQKRYAAENYFGRVDVTIAKPVTRGGIILQWNDGAQFLQENDDDDNNNNVPAGRRDVVVGYRLSRLTLATTVSSEPFRPVATTVSGGDSIVHYQLLSSENSILDQSSSKVGYIRLTRFSRGSTTRFLEAIDALERGGAQSYILDLRNNYGGIIQEAMLAASTVLRDPHAVLCYTMNSRGGFTPHDVEEYIMDKRYPGYLLSSEPKDTVLNQLKRESPELFQEGGGWMPPSSFASLHEQHAKRGIHRGGAAPSTLDSSEVKQWNAALLGTMLSSPSSRLVSPLNLQKKIVVLINEGTASSAEVFASSLHDNGRTVALIGTKTYGKGLIQHTFPMPDGGGLRLTVAEYLTPSLRHVTNVGSAQYDRRTGEWVGGGIRPDVMCESKQGIPNNVGADLCVGVALDALEEAEVQEAMAEATTGQTLLKRVGGTLDGSGTRHPISAGIVRDDF